MNIVLLNLTRFGDLLQSQAAISDLAAQGHKIALVCQENFAQAGTLLKHISLVFPFQGAQTLEILAQEGKASPEDAFGHWTRAMAGLGAWRDALHGEFVPDAVINLTPTLAARLLALYVAGGAPCRGFALDAHGFGVNGNGWAAFLQSASVERGVSPFNVADLFRRAAESGGKGRPGDGSLLPPDETLREQMAALLDAERPGACGDRLKSGEARGYVGLQLGASEDRRRWPVEYFAELGDRLWLEAGLCPVLFGSKAEAALAERYMAVSRQGCVNLAGRTGLQELAAALTHMKMLVTNDTGTMHLAAGLGVPVLAVFLATAQPFDTGPYRAGSCSVEPDMDCHPCAFGRACDKGEACRRAVAPDVLARLALAKLTTGQWPAGPGAGARVWEAEDDGTGFLTLRSLSGHDDAVRSLWLALQRRYIGAYLDRAADGAFTPPDPSCSAEGAARLPAAWRAETAGRVKTASELALLFAQQGKVLAATHRQGMGDRLLGTWNRVRDFLASQPGFAALSMLWVQETQGADKELGDVLASAEVFHAMTAALAHALMEQSLH